MIIRQPQSQAQAAGATATFKVIAWSRRGPAYQWQFNGANMAGGTSTNLVISNVQDSNQGTYRVMVSNGAGAVWSDAAQLELALPPVIVWPVSPQVVWLPPGSNFVLSVYATAQGEDLAGLSYLWYKDGERIPWALSLSNLALGMFEAVQEGQYSVVVTNIAGSTSSVPWMVHVMAPGTVVAWGGDGDGVEAPPFGMSNILAVASGLQHAAAVMEGGTVIAWGNNDYGQTNVPADVTNVVAIACGSEHTLALKADGTVSAWGRDQDHATEVPDGMTNVVAIAAGGTHNLAMLKTGGLTNWGMEIGAMPAGLADARAVAAGVGFDVALKADGTVVAWGANDLGQTNVPANLLSNVVAVAAGDRHGLALKADGTVVSWGDNSAGQTNVPPDLTNAMAIAAGSLFSMALRNDGTVVGWGDDSAGQLEVIGNLPLVKAVAAGGNHTLAALFSPLVQYQVDVTKDLLLIYNTNSADSIFVKDYYLANRPMVSGANVLGIGCPTNEIIDAATFTNQILASVQGWLAANPTKPPQYMILFPAIPSRVWSSTNCVYCPVLSVAYGLYTSLSGIPPFVSSINMGMSDLTNDCIAYINKLGQFGTNYSPGKLIISASSGGYENTNYLVDDVSIRGSVLAPTTNALLAAGVPASAITYLAGTEPCILYEYEQQLLAVPSPAAHH